MRHYLRIVSLLALSSFCLGVAEFLVSGILPKLGAYYGVSVSEAGNLATLYALGVVIGAPIVSVLISRFNYRNQLIFTLGIFAISNALMFFSHSFLGALIARFIGGLMHGLFFVIATLVCLKAAPKSKTSMAMSLMASGLTVALVTGVPLGILVAKHFGLLAPFLLVAGLASLAALLALFVLPKFSSKPANFKNLGIAFHFPPLWQGFLVTAFSCGSMFVVYIYLRVLLEKHGFSPESIADLYLYYGLAAMLGNLFGGKLTDLRGSFAALRFLLGMQILALSAMSLTYNLPKMVLAFNVMAFGFFGFACIAPLKMLSGHLARLFTPNTTNSTIALNESSFNLGITFASLMGGLVAHWSVDFNGFCAALFALSAFTLLHLRIKKAYFHQKSA
ncbi:MFS transporter [Helicobacter ailurogastricus]|uniref:MFS transporter n=1 Tax=Helicobacter ailurogastricus TaxID=1578720 RepID=UPI0022BE89EF|nr:MFS transporter [Helicobacter ailurogastricus]GLH58648.1 MFS transporter [Helicobacter ailurogastricus]GLH60177.1 MFS transporter [Helicobacter ailurogastricus]